MVKIDHGDPASGLERLPDGGEISRTIVEMMIDIAEKEQVDGLSRQLSIVRLGEDKFHRCRNWHASDAGLCVLQHVGFDIDRIDFSLLGHGLNESPSEISRTGADV